MDANEKTVYETGNRTVIDESTVYEEQENQVVESENQYEVGEETNKKGWRKVAAGFGGGVLMGSLATILTASSKVPEEASTDELTTEVEIPGLIGEIKVAQTVNDDMSFGEAFASARAEVGSGGAFVWHGNVYNTYTADEWNAMTDEQRDAFGDNFQSQAANIDVRPSSQVAQNYTSDTDLEIVDTVPANNATTQVQPEIEVLGMAQDPQSGAVAAGLKIDGKEYVVVDIDNNNVADVVIADINGDGYISENEIGDISAEGILMSDIASIQNNQNLAMGPDYVNDADTTGYEA